jgi:hypothetical protein
VISLCCLSFSILVRKHGRKEIRNEEMEEGKKDGRANTEGLNK